jgi:hypothetical protein
MTTAYFRIAAAAREDPAGEEYRVRLRVEGSDSDPAPEAVALLGDELVEVLDGVSGDRPAEFTSVLALGASEADREAVGDRLFAALAGGSVGELWGNVRSSGSALAPLRVCLEIEPQPLRALPWELLRQDHAWLFRDAKLLWSRGNHTAGGAGERGPLRVLLVVCNPADHKVMADEEVAVVGAALGSAPGRGHVQVLDGPSLTQLSVELERLRPHVLHFIGHGMPAVPGDTAGIPFNWIPSGLPDGAPVPRPWMLSSTAVVDLLGTWQPPLVVLNACRSTADPMDRLGGLSEAFLAAGAGMVVSMQADVQSTAATSFVKVFYRKLWIDPVDKAVADGRRELYQKYQNAGDWALPVLHTRLDPASALKIRFTPTEESIRKLCGMKGFVDLKLFLDRAAQRRDAWWALDPLDQGDQGGMRSLLVVTGRSGKTWFTLSCLLTCFLRGHRITYVNLAQKLKHPDPGYTDREVQSKDWLDLLRTIREACVDPKQPEPLPESAFFGFNNLLNSLLAGNPPLDAGMANAAAVGGGSDGSGADQWRRFNDNAVRAEDRRARIFRAFLDALKDASGDRTHVLALDQAENVIGDSFRDVVYPQLIEPVAGGREPPIKLILVAHPEWIDEWLPSEDKGLWDPSVTLVDFEKREFIRLANEYCKRVGLDYGSHERLFLEAEKKLKADGVPVKLFAKINSMIECMNQAGGES